MGKFVFWVGVAALIWLGFRLYQVLRRKAEQQRASPPGTTGEGKDGRAERQTRSPPPEASDAPLPMIRCRHCGLYLPGNEAVRSGDAPYCSIEHRDAAASDRARR